MILRISKSLKKLIAVSMIAAMVLMMTISSTLPTTAADTTDTWICDEYISYIEEISAEYGICPELIEAIVEHESSGQANARNGNCKGLMQIYEKYHRDRMKRLGVTDLYDPYSNILVGTDYLMELAEKYEDLPMVLLVYNGVSNAEEIYESGNYTDYVKSIMARSEELERLHGK